MADDLGARSLARLARAVARAAPAISPEDAFAYGAGIPADADWRNLLPAAELGLAIAPGSGEAMAARDAWEASGRGAEALGEGRYGDAVGDYADLATGLAGAIPGAGIVARGTKRGAQWMDRNLPEGFNRLLDAVMPSDPRSTTNIFAGPTAKTADHAALAKAQEMAAGGASRDDILRDTGWFQGVDGKWRFEIDDSGADLSNRATQAFDAGNPTQAPIGEIVDHPALWQAYPEMGSQPALLQKGSPQGSYFPTGALHAQAPNYDDAVSVNLHELQHGAQVREGFAGGANPQSAYLAFLSDLRERTRPMLDEIVRRREAGLDASDLQARFDTIWEQAQKVDDSPSLQYQLYRRNAGEAEARNVQSRMNMTAAERRAKGPWKTQDVPDDQQIVRGR